MSKTNKELAAELLIAAVQAGKIKINQNREELQAQSLMKQYAIILAALDAADASDPPMPPAR